MRIKKEKKKPSFLSISLLCNKENFKELNEDIKFLEVISLKRKPFK